MIFLPAKGKQKGMQMGTRQMLDGKTIQSQGRYLDNKSSQPAAVADKRQAQRTDTGRRSRGRSYSFRDLGHRGAREGVDQKGGGCKKWEQNPENGTRNGTRTRNDRSAFVPP